MKTTKLLAALCAALLLFGAAACSSDSDDGETSTQDESSSSGNDSSSSGDGDSSDGDSSSGGDLDDLGDLGDLPFNLEDCLSVSLTYAGIYLSALGGEEAMQEALGDLEELTTQVPESIQDDLEVIADGMAEAGTLTDVGDFFDSDEYMEADANIQAYLEAECGG